MFLYMRMGLTIIVNLYTVRVIWDVLGIDNYGIYNVVGGIVLMFQFLNNAMIASSQRFIAYELGTGNTERLRRVFSVSVKVHYLLAGLILVLAETIGLWFLNHKLNIPAQRMFAANCVYQCSIAAFFLNVISVPYNACIVAHEHMKAYGYFGILNVVLKLLIVYLLIIIPFDKLIAYAALVLCVEATMRLLYQVYCRKKFQECHYAETKDNELVRDMFSFAGWSFLGNMGFSFRDQGLNIILNMFFSVAMNAAKGIANQATGALNGFTAYFTMALNPQITKSYAAGDTDGMVKLMFRGCKFSFLLLNMIVTPVIICCDELLHLWLHNVEEFTIGFLRIMLVAVLVDSMASPIVTALQATGRIRRFQIAIAIVMVSCLPLAWLWLEIDAYPYAVVFVALLSSVVALLTRLYLLREQIQFSVRGFLIKTVLRSYPVAILSAIVCWLLYRITFFHAGLLSTIIFLTLSCISCIAISTIALTRNERNYILKIATGRFAKKGAH